MKPYIINQFLFPYQRSFATNLRSTAKQVFGRIGVDDAPEVFLVGVAWPPLPERHGVCVEPEDGLWAQSVFADIPNELDTRWREHPQQMMFYGDEPTMRDKPENIRRVVVSEAVRDSLARPSRSLGLRSFVSTARLVEGYYVTVVLQLREELVSRFPPVPYRWMNEQFEASFLTVCAETILTHAERVLMLPEPGRFSHDELGSAEEIVRQAGHRFMRIPFLEGEMPLSDLFDDFNAISRTMYEGAGVAGRMTLVQPADPTIRFVLKLANPVPLRRTRWARKLLQMGSGDHSLLVSASAILGLGTVSGVGSPPFSVEFFDRHHWDFRRGREVLLRTQFGDPKLPQEPIADARFFDNFQRIFPMAGEQAAKRFRGFLDLLIGQPCGSMMVVADDAAAEAERLQQQGTRIEPVPLSEALIEQASRIDGTILVDPLGVCHAVGVILDGMASDRCTPSRGARFNSAMRYVAATTGRLAFVVSEDRTLDVVPLLRPRMSTKVLEAMVTALESATVDDYHASRNWLADHRFYLNADQCARANAALRPLDELACKEGQLVWQLGEFTPDAEMNDRFLTA